MLPYGNANLSETSQINLVIFYVACHLFLEILRSGELKWRKSTSHIWQ